MVSAQYTSAMIEITRVDNGYVVSHTGIDGTPVMGHTSVFSDQDGILDLVRGLIGRIPPRKV